MCVCVCERVEELKNEHHHPFSFFHPSIHSFLQTHALHRLPVSHDDGFPVQGFQLLSSDGEDGGVGLQEDAGAGPDGVEAAMGGGEGGGRRRLRKRLAVARAALSSVFPFISPLPLSLSLSHRTVMSFSSHRPRPMM